VQFTANVGHVVVEYGRFADTYGCIKTAFHDTDILADILTYFPLDEDREDVGEDVGVVSWNAVFMQLYVSAKRPQPVVASVGRLNVVPATDCMTGRSLYTCSVYRP